MSKAGLRVKEIFSAARVTQVEVAEYLKVTEQAVSGYARSDTIGVKVAENICEAVFKLTGKKPNREYITSGTGEPFLPGEVEKEKEGPDGDEGDLANLRDKDMPYSSGENYSRLEGKVEMYVEQG